jgi:ABC-type antimicrobial peptide transport system permease subunit
VAYDKKRLTVPMILALIVGAGAGVLAASQGWDWFEAVLGALGTVGLSGLAYALVRGSRDARK